MLLPELIEGRLIRRYKRFLADVRMPDGSIITAHCPNTGAMTGCAPEDAPVWLSTSDNPKRKYAHTWELVQTELGLVSVNTNRANALVAEALHSGVTSLGQVDEVRAEVAIPEGDGRFDFSVSHRNKMLWIEVKSVTLLVSPGVGAFPDAVSTRALKHVAALQRRIETGDEAALIFCAQHCGVEEVRLADHIDAQYAAAVRQAADRGLQVYALGCMTDLQQFRVDRQLPVVLDQPG